MSSLKENKMGTRPVGRLLFFMALPLALSMLVQAFYNVVDSMFVARISDVDQDALNAVGSAVDCGNLFRVKGCADHAVGAGVDYGGGATGLTENAGTDQLFRHCFSPCLFLNFFISNLILTGNEDIIER